jgi:hypothetical protein
MAEELKLPTRGTNRSFSLVSQFNGYRNREDVTNLPAGIMVKGSQNVLTNVSDRLGIRKGYTLDGQAASLALPILGSYDWQMHNGQERHLRVYFSGGGAAFQYRFVDSAGVVTWRNLFNVATPSGISSVNFAEFWDTTELIDVLLMVVESPDIFEWSGGVTTFASATANTITKQGTSTWAEESFYTAGTRKVVIDTIEYTYTGGEGTTTLTGVTPDPTAGGHAVGAPIHQAVRQTANSAMTGIPAALKNDLISVLYNQIYVGSFKNRTVYISKVNNYKDYSFSSPSRLVGEGATVTLDATPVAFVPQEDEMYMSAGRDFWYQTLFKRTTSVTASDVGAQTIKAFEDLIVRKLKTSPLQAAQSQAMVSKIKNDVMFVSNEPTLDTLGRVESILGTPQTANVSDPIKIDFDNYDFTDGSVFFFRQYLLVAVPREGIVRIFNLSKGFWEAPQILPIARFSIIDGELYGHGYLTAETYKLFDGLSDNGAPIDARAVFSYQNFGSRELFKKVNELYAEGYIASNTQLKMNVKFEAPGCGSDLDFNVPGDDSDLVCLGAGDNHLGSNPLGSNPLGGTIDDLTDPLPPKFRIYPTLVPTDFYELQITFSTNNDDQQWEIIAFGVQARMSNNDNVANKR